MFNGPRKRCYEEDGQELELDSKRSCSLPFRFSPTAKHTRSFSQSSRNRPRPLFTQTLTPADSSEEETSPFVNGLPRPPQSLQLDSSSIQRFNECFDADMDMGDTSLAGSQSDPDTVMLSPRTTDCTLMSPQLGSLGLEESSKGGRLPTPIYGHFQQSMENKMPVDEKDPPKSQNDVDFELYMGRRRLPSPISEDEAMDVSEGARETSKEMDDHGLRIPARFPPPLPNQRPRSGKIMFSMGFRADCEMCRNRVPGHCNHIFRA